MHTMLVKFVRAAMAHVFDVTIAEMPPLNCLYIMFRLSKRSASVDKFEWMQYFSMGEGFSVISLLRTSFHARHHSFMLSQGK